MTAKKIPELKILQCPLCLKMLEWDNDLGAYRCKNSKCNAELWPDPMDKTQLSKPKPVPEYICRSLVSDVPGGSSSGKKYGAKDRMKKPTTHQIYEKLCGK
jgi:hypothetical protein